MNLKLRRSIFYFLIVVFFILAAFIIPYSNGLRFDFKTFGFVKLGGLYIETEPAETNIQVDRLNFQTKPGFIKSGLLIANLFPKTYYVSVQKEGYQSWTKNITVKPSLVTQIYQIVLLPRMPEKEFVSEKVESIYFGPSIIIQNTSGILTINKKIAKGTSFISWLAGEKSFLVYDQNNKSYFIINTLQNNTALNITLAFNNLKEQKNIIDTNSIRKIIPHFYDKNKLIANTGKNLYLFDFNKPSLEIIKKGGFTLLNTSGDDLFFSDSSKLYVYNLNTKTESVLSESANIKSLEISKNKNFVLFSNSKNLILFNRVSNTYKELSGSPLSFAFSPDDKKIAALYNDKSVKIYFIGDDYELFGKKEFSESNFKIDNIDPSSPITWHTNSSYIYIKTENDFRMMEINDANPINFHTINILAEKYYYDPRSDLVYIIDKGNLYKLKMK